MDENYVAHARNRLGLRSVKFRYLAAEYRASRNDGVLHARHARVDTEFRRPRRLGARLEAFAIVADDREIVRIFQRNRVEIWDRQLGRAFHGFPVGQKLLAVAWG